MKCILFYLVLIGSTLFGSSCSKSKDQSVGEPLFDLDTGDARHLQVEPLRKEMEKFLPISEFHQHLGTKELEDTLSHFQTDSTYHLFASDGTLTNAGKLASGIMKYLDLVLRNDCPQEEREVFCNFAEAVLTGYVESADGNPYGYLMVLLASDGIEGWGGPGGWNGDVNAAFEFWRSSEIYQYLMLGTPFKSPRLKERLEMINDGWGRKPRSQNGASTKTGEGDN